MQRSTCYDKRRYVAVGGGHGSFSSPKQAKPTFQKSFLECDVDDERRFARHLQKQQWGLLRAANVRQQRIRPQLEGSE
jgi:hypothetical protein